MPPKIVAACPNCGWTTETLADCGKNESGVLVCPVDGAVVIMPEDEGDITLMDG